MTQAPFDDVVKFIMDVQRALHDLSPDQVLTIKRWSSGEWLVTCPAITGATSFAASNPMPTLHEAAQDAIRALKIVARDAVAEAHKNTIEHIEHEERLKHTFNVLDFLDTKHGG